MNADEFKKLLLKLPDGEKACSDAREWAEGKTLKQAYDECGRADWILWLFCKMSDQPGWPNLRQVIGASVRCAETALHIFEEKFPEDKRPRECIEACYKYERGEIDLEELIKYRRDANAAADAAYYAAYYAANAAADAAYYAAYYAANAAAAAWAAADADAAADANAAADAAAWAAAACAKKQHVIMCNIIRTHLKLPQEA